MKIVMADVEADPLATATERVRQKAPAVVSVRVDVPEIKGNIAVRAQDLLELRNPSPRRG
jgi:hypothetical protein